MDPRSPSPSTHCHRETTGRVGGRTPATMPGVTPRTVVAQPDYHRAQRPHIAPRPQQFLDPQKTARQPAICDRPDTARHDGAPWSKIVTVSPPGISLSSIPTRTPTGPGGSPGIWRTATTPCQSRTGTSSPARTGRPGCPSDVRRRSPVRGRGQTRQTRRWARVILPEACFRRFELGGLCCRYSSHCSRFANRAPGRLRGTGWVRARRPRGRLEGSSARSLRLEPVNRGGPPAPDNPHGPRSRPARTGTPAGRARSAKRTRIRPRRPM